MRKTTARRVKGHAQRRPIILRARTEGTERDRVLDRLTTAEAQDLADELMTAIDETRREV